MLIYSQGKRKNLLKYAVKLFSSMILQRTSNFAKEIISHIIIILRMVSSTSFPKGQPIYFDTQEKLLSKYTIKICLAIQERNPTQSVQ